MCAVESRDQTQWHQAFVGAMHFELGEDLEKLILEQEYSLTKKPLQTDLLIIKKNAADRLNSSLGRFLRNYNILEYKSPDDHLGVDALFQALTYACYYKSEGKYENERKDQDISVILIRARRPKALFRYLEQEKGCRLCERENGIYEVTGPVFFNILILVTREMSREEHLWLNVLRNDLERNEYIRLLEKCRGIAADEGDYLDVLLSVVEKSNADHKVWKEELRVASLLVEARKEGRKEGEQRGISIGEQRGISIGEQRGISIGEQRGISIGEQRGKFAIAANMLRDGKLTTEEIMLYTGLTHDQILRLKNKTPDDLLSEIPF